MAKICALCNSEFEDNSPNDSQIYCTDTCKQRAENKRYYQRHKDEMIARVKVYRAKKRKRTKKRSAQ